MGERQGGYQPTTDPGPVPQNLVRERQTLRITVEHLQRGQPAPYAPHTYEALITLEGTYGHTHLTEQQVRRIVQGAVHGFTEEPPDNTMDSHFKPRLREQTLVEGADNEFEYGKPYREVYRVRVEEPFTD